MDETAAPAAVFRARGLSVAAGGTTLVSGLDLTLAPGELVALTGPSGGGKTTLLRALCALDDPAAGDVLLEGRSPTDWGHPAFRRRAVFVPQQPFLAPDETVDDALRRPFAFRSGRAAGQTYEPARTDALLDRLGVGSARREQRARSLSVGQQQRVCLVRAVLLSPAVLFLDEPTGALDPDATAAVEALISEEADVRGLAALIVTHNPEQAARWCSRRIDLRDFAPKAVAP